MTSKEKSKEIYNKFYELHKTSNQPKFRTINSCLYMVSEIILTIQTQIICIDVERTSHLDLIKYWEDVKTELEKI
jgi:hypothetical protein